jgi:Zn-dependent protease
VCVVLHELGHSVVAQSFGVKVQDITLWPIGGVARMTRIPERPYQEFLIAAAGPATNFVLAFGLGVALMVWDGPRNLLYNLARYIPGLAGPLAVDLGWHEIIYWLVASNVFLALFNLIPAFPMDGGRLLRSFLAVFLPFRSATRLASYLGQAVAGLMIAGGLFSSDFFLALVGFFIFLGAGFERQQVSTGDQLKGLRVRQAMQPIGPRLHPLQTLGDVARQAGGLPQAAYLVVDAGRLTGLLGRRDLLAALRSAGPTARIAQFVRREFLQVGPDDLLPAALERMVEHRSWVAVVVQDGCVAGLLSSSDMTRMGEVAEAWPGLRSE